MRSSRLTSLERPPNSDIDALPGIADVTHALIVAVAVGRAALCYRDRALEGVDDLGGTDLVSRAGQLVPAVGAARRRYEARPAQ